MSARTPDPLQGVDDPTDADLALLDLEGPAIEADRDLTAAEIDEMVNPYAPDTRYRVRKARWRARRAYVTTQITLHAALIALISCRPEHRTAQPDRRAARLGRRQGGVS